MVAAQNTALVRADEAWTPADVVDHPSGYLALSPKTQRFTLDDKPGFVAYREQGKHMVLFGGVHAPLAERASLLDAFLHFAEERSRRVVAVQIRNDQVELFGSRGFIVNRFGQSYGLSLNGFSMGGTKRMKLRNKIKRAKAGGLRVVEVGREIPRDESTFSQIKRISEVWLKNKGKKELDFMIGELGNVEDGQRRIFAVLGALGQMLGFITYVPVYGSRPGYLHDLTRRLPEAPAGTMELCNSVALERLREEHQSYLHFGFTPFVVEGEGSEGPFASGVVSWIIRKLYKYGRLIYPARSQAEYKLKWAPDVIEPEYVAFKPLSLRAIVDLLILTRSV
jgi:lysylphosphatidylglycerol synthetase-like protein (DUF2156 family)